MSESANERTVVIYRSGDQFEVEAIAQRIRDRGIECHVDGVHTAGVFAGFTALDGVTMMSVIVLESDAEEAFRIAEQWLESGDASVEDEDGG